MVIVILGAKGLVGSAIKEKLESLGYVVYGFGKEEVDIRNLQAIINIIENLKPNFIINAAAYLNVDKCELNYHESYLTNVKGVANIIKAIRTTRIESILVHFSSDFVFDGKKGNYTEDDTPNPINVYGMHKFMADELILNSDIPHYIFRIAGVIGWHPSKNNFLKAILKKAAREKKVEVVKDIYTSCSTPEFISDILIEFLNKKPPFGLYNVVAEGQTSWYEIANFAFQYYNLHYTIIPIESSKFNYIAKRPTNSTLSVMKLSNQLNINQNWKDVIQLHLKSKEKNYLEIIQNENK